MPTYATSYSGTYDADLEQFEVESDPLPTFVTYEIADTSYDIGGPITVIQLVNGTTSQEITGILLGYSDIGFAFQRDDTDAYEFITTETDLPFGAEIPLTTSDPYVVCFLAGTMIATPSGETPIEELKRGDLVLTADGSAKPVRWLARQTISTIFADPLRVMPVRISAGTLGEDLPNRDLYVSMDHALLFDGLLVQAGALVNGATITRHTAMPQSFVYYHVELEDHSLVLAEGMAAETFVDNVTRRRFDNWQEAPEAPVSELELPRVKSARQLPAAIRARLAARTAA